MQTITQGKPWFMSPFEGDPPLCFLVNLPCHSVLPSSMFKLTEFPSTPGPLNPVPSRLSIRLIQIPL